MRSRSQRCAAFGGHRRCKRRSRRTRAPRGHVVGHDGRDPWRPHRVRRPDVVDLNVWLPYAQEVARNQARIGATFKVWLASGVTGVVDVGGPFWNFDVRDLARRSEVAPRVAVAGPLISLVPDAPLGAGEPPIIEVRTPEQARALAERELARHPDDVKAWFIHRPKDDRAAQSAIVRAAAEAAHAAGVPFAVHATELVVAKAALRAGADFLVHSGEDEAVDDEFIALMKRNGALYCPTLFGTRHGPSVLREMALMREAGLSPLQVLR